METLLRWLLSDSPISSVVNGGFFCNRDRKFLYLNLTGEFIVMVRHLKKLADDATFPAGGPPWALLKLAGFSLPVCKELPRSSRWTD